jgi:hypothetical protein
MINAPFILRKIVSADRRRGFDGTAAILLDMFHDLIIRIFEQPPEKVVTCVYLLRAETSGSY